MRIALACAHDLASLYGVNLLLKELGERHEWALFVSSASHGASAQPQLAELDFLEDDLPAQILFPLIQAASPSSTSARPELLTYEGLQSRFGVPLVTVNHRTDHPEVVQAFEAFRPDLIVSIRFRKILREPVLKLPRHGAINLHSGPLPEYRGILATFWGLLRGDAEIGCTLHTITDSTIDTGTILHRALRPADRTRSLLSQILDHYPAGAHLIAKTISELEVKGRLPAAQAQDNSRAAYYRFPQAEDLRRFHDLGLRLYDPVEYLAFLRRFLP
jgi:methionyl-tRNA formyltransferase